MIKVSKGLREELIEIVRHQRSLGVNKDTVMQNNERIVDAIIEFLSKIEED
jgi:hypothetical protein